MKLTLPEAFTFRPFLMSMFTTTASAKAFYSSNSVMEDDFIESNIVHVFFFIRMSIV